MYFLSSKEAVKGVEMLLSLFISRDEQETQEKRRQEKTASRNMCLMQHFSRDKTRFLSYLSCCTHSLANYLEIFLSSGPFESSLFLFIFQKLVTCIYCKWFLNKKDISHDKCEVYKKEKQEEKNETWEETRDILWRHWWSGREDRMRIMFPTLIFLCLFRRQSFAGLSDLFLDSLFHPWFSWILSFSVDTYSLHLLTFQYRYKPLLSPGGFIAETLVSLLNVFFTFLSFKRKIYDFIWKNKKRRLSLQRQDVQSGCFILLFWLQASSSSHSYEFRSKSRGLNINAFENIMLLECMMRTLLLKHSKVYTKRFERQT